MSAWDGGIEVPWQWSFVPAPGGDPAAEARWSAGTAAVFDGWLAQYGGSGAAAGTGGALAADLRRRAGEVPAGARLVWGAAFDAERPRWWPVQVVVERVAGPADDPDYLLGLVGARTVVDGVAPNVRYLSTDRGDCVRVIRPERGPDGRVNALVRAATRIDWPATGGVPAARSDFLLTARTWDMALLAVLGPGVDLLMGWMAGAGERPAERMETR
jgi:hypothetical protein